MSLSEYKEKNSNKLESLWIDGAGLGYDSFEGFCFAQWQGDLKNE